MVRCLLAAMLLVLGCGSTVDGERAGSVSMHVEGLLLDPRTDSPVLVLREESGERRELPIWIGTHEALAIQREIDKRPLPRPDTHDLIKNVLVGLGARIERVTVTELRGGTYYAEIALGLGPRTITIDSRPSDAIAVAVRIGAPVFATGKVLRQATRDTDEASAHEVSWVHRRPGPRAGSAQ